jgi:spermidine synthase
VLLLAVTNKLCQDVAVIPFLWVLPLSLYLLSFILCFAGPKWYQRRPFALLLWPALGAACVALFIGLDYPLPAQIASYGAALWAGCMVCHGELYRLRPWPAHLTEYYLMIAAGGALGGIFVGLVAPLIFPDFLELPLALCGCPALLGVAYLSQRTFLRLWKWLVPAWMPMLLLVAGLGVALTIQERRANRDLISSTRNFYGVLKVFEYEPNKPRDRVHVLLSGEITHGFQFMDPELAAWPTTYYHEQSGVGLAWAQLPQDRPRRVGMVGLGAGTLALYGRTNDVLRFYEINDEVLDTALTYFTWLTNCPAHVEVVLGDARLSLEREAPQHFDMLVLDAFSGDAVPVHLLTREAMEIYLRHLAPHGVLAAHITNRHVALAPVLARLAEQFHLHFAVINYEKQKKGWWRYSTSWMLLTRTPAFLEQEAIRQAAAPRSTKYVKSDLWTDDHNSLLKVIRWGGR